MATTFEQFKTICKLAEEVTGINFCWSKAAVEMAVWIAECDVQQARVSIRRIMETFVSTL